MLIAKHGKHAITRCFASILLGACFLTSAMAQEVSLLIGPGHPLLADSRVSVGELLFDPEGNLYTYHAFSIMKITPDGSASLILKIAPETNAILLGGSQIPARDVNGMPVSIEFVSEMAFGLSGDFYVANNHSNQVIRIRADGIVEEIINAAGDGKGHVLDRPGSISVDNFGNVYVGGNSSENLFKITPDGEISQILDRNGAGNSLFIDPAKILFDEENNGIIGSSYGLFMIKANGEISELLDTKMLKPIRAGNVVPDSVGNLYMLGGEYRRRANGEVERILDRQVGDGTGGRTNCVTGPFHTLSCYYYGNRISGNTSVFVDAANNLFLVGSGSKNIYKITPNGFAHEVFDFNDIEEFYVQNMSRAVFDLYGNLYFTSSTDRSLFKLAPLPVEGANDILIGPPHSEVVHSAVGIEILPDNYSTTEVASGAHSIPVIMKLDTRDEPWAGLPWQNAIFTTDADVPETDESFRTLAATLTLNNSTHVVEIGFHSFPNPNQNQINSMTYSVNGDPIYAATRLDFPLNSYYFHEGQYLMRWVYSGNDVINGGESHDVLYGFDGNDILYGHGGDDAFNGGRGSDIYYGGAGVDSVYYEFDREDYALSRNPLTGVVEVQSKTGFAYPYPDHVMPDVEVLYFRDASVNTSELNYWGESSILDPAPANDGTNSIIYRFYNARDNALFYTSSAEEKLEILGKGIPREDQREEWPFIYQGAKFRAATTYDGAVPLHRFYNTRTGHHFFTADEEEVNEVNTQIEVAGWPFVYEGTAFDVYLEDPTPLSKGVEVPVYRYYSPELDRHFFTASEREAEVLDASNLWNFEGIRFYAEDLYQ